MPPQPEFATAAWVEALDASAAAVDLGDGAAEVEGIVVQQVVTGEPGAAWTLGVEDGRVRVRPGRADRADVTLTSDRATAEAVNRGDESAQAAFMAGRLRIGGDPMALVRLQPVMALVGAGHGG